MTATLVIDVAAAADADIWADGALTTREAMAFIKRKRSMFCLDAKVNNWPRRYRGKGALWPKRVLAQYLANLPTVRGKRTV